MLLDEAVRRDKKGGRRGGGGGGGGGYIREFEFDMC